MAYVGWNNMPKGMSPALKAYIGRKKYSKKTFQKAAAEGKSLKGVKPASASAHKTSGNQGNAPVYHGKKKK